MKFICVSTICILLSILLKIKTIHCADGPTFRTACRQEAAVTDEEFDKYFNHGLQDADGTDSIKRFYKCMMDKYGVIKDGKFVEQEFVKKVNMLPAFKENAALYTKVAGLCKDIQGDNDNETALKVGACFRDNKAPLTHFVTADVAL